MQTFSSPEQLVETALNMNPSPYNYWYMASVYTSHPGGRETAFNESAKIAAWLMSKGLNIVAPIPHSHPISEHMAAEFDTHALWMKQDKPMVFKSFGLIVCKMPGWGDSRGVTMERGWAYEMNKPVLGLDLDTILKG